MRARWVLALKIFDFQCHGPSGHCHLLQGGLGTGHIGGIDEQGDASGSGQQLTQQTRPLGDDLGCELGRVNTNCPCHVLRVILGAWRSPQPNSSRSQTVYLLSVAMSA